MTEPTHALRDDLAEVEDCINSIHQALRHRQQPQDSQFHRALKHLRQAAARLEALGSGVVVPSADRIALIYFVAHAIKTDFFEGDEIDAEVRAWLEASRNEIPSGMTVEQVVRAMLDARPK